MADIDEENNTEESYETDGKTEDHGEEMTETTSNDAVEENGAQPPVVTESGSAELDNEATGADEDNDQYEQQREESPGREDDRAEDRSHSTNGRSRRRSHSSSSSSSDNDDHRKRKRERRSSRDRHSSSHGGSGGGYEEKPGSQINASRDNEDDRKIFVGGLSWETTNWDVKEYFSRYGAVVDCTLKTDPNTGKSRGFGFVLFESSSSVAKVFAESTHMLNGRKIDPKKAVARGNASFSSGPSSGGGGGSSASRDAARKVFVGGLPPDFPESDIREYFSKFGRIVEIEQPFDKIKNQRRPFIFITYESEDIVENIIANPKQSVGGREVDVRRATPKSDQDRSGRGPPGSQQRGPPPASPWGPMPGYGAPPGYDYYSSYYGQYAAAGYPPGYDYSAYYSAYYGQPPMDWSGYSQAAGASAPGGYPPTGYGAPPAGYAPPSSGYAPPAPAGGYDYSSWYGTDPKQK